MTDENSETATSNSTNQEPRKATVSVRNIELTIWWDARRNAMEKQMTMAQYITSLIEQDLSNNE